MNLSKLPTEQLKELKKVEELKSILKDYSGDDRVVSIEDVWEILENQPESQRIDMGLPKVNKLLDGFRCGDLIVVTGPTGHGKTTLLQSFTHDFFERGISSTWFSYEVGLRDLIKRFGADVPIFSLPLKTKDSNIKWLEQRIWEAVSKYNSKVIFVDHLHYLLDMAYLAKVNTSLAIGMLMRDLKKLAIETDTVIFLVAHLSKTKLEEEPGLDDIRDSSFIGQESDAVLVIYRDKDQDGVSWLKVAKNRRMGTLAKTKIILKGKRFYEIAY